MVVNIVGSSYVCVKRKIRCKSCGTTIGFYAVWKNGRLYRYQNLGGCDGDPSGGLPDWEDVFGYMCLHIVKAEEVVYPEDYPLNSKFLEYVFNNYLELIEIREITRKLKNRIRKFAGIEIDKAELLTTLLLSEDSKEKEIAKKILKVSEIIEQEQVKMIVV